jgi:two-component system, cell cycle sensor histidine kinase and response regulator CckA
MAPKPSYEDLQKQVETLEREVAACRESGERKKAEEAFKESELKLKTILDSIEAGIVLIDAENYRIVEANPAAVEMLGKPKAQLIGQLCYENICPYDRTTCPITDHTNTYTGECSLTKRAGKEIPVIKNVTGVVLNGRRYMVESFIDISERKRLEAQLYQSQKMEAIGTLAGGIAHDFNNLLMGIQGNASLMMLTRKPGDSDYDRLINIEQHIQNGADLTNQLLSFAMRGKYESRQTDLNRLIQKSAEMFGRTKKEIVIYQKYQEEIWTVDLDRGQIEQVLLNLFINSWQAMPGGGKLYIETQNVSLDEAYVKSFEAKPGEYVKISITDTGAGIEKEIQERIFDPFFTTKALGRGTGLGLASVYGIVRNHCGFITLDSKKGGGSSFSIYLPASGNRERIEPETDAAESFLRGEETVLVVDDEEIVIEVTEKILVSLGYRVFTAGSGKEAVERLKNATKKIDIVILDMIMPAMGGKETFDELKAVDPGIKILLASGYTMDEQAEAIMQKGCDGFIQKPFRFETLSRKIKDILSLK